MTIHHLNCGLLHKPPAPEAGCHCLLLEDSNSLVLIDTGIGLQDVLHPEERVGTDMIESAGFQFYEELTAIRQIETLGYRADAVRHIVLSHMDHDHTGGVADFPNAKVHVSEEEYEAFLRGAYRYYPGHFWHHPDIEVYSTTSARWYGWEARQLRIDFPSPILMIPLFGHTRGHCGIAIQTPDTWLFYIGDAYYLRAQLYEDNHPVEALATLRAEDDQMRRESLDRLRTLMTKHGPEIQVFGYHDLTEFEQSCIQRLRNMRT